MGKTSKKRSSPPGLALPPNLSVACLRSHHKALVASRMRRATAADKMDTFFVGYRQGAQEYSGFIGAELGRAMGSGISLGDQEILYGFQQRVEADIKRRYPDFDFRKEIDRHA